MAQSYILVARRNPERLDEPPKYYPQAHSEKKIDIVNICKRISERFSYSQGEFEGCIGEFLIEIQHVLEEGNIAQLGRLGSFCLTLKSNGGTATQKEFKATMIKKSYLCFHPSIQLQALCKIMQYVLHYFAK